ncbi:MAG TPA: hemerythrin domain-containing protein [Terriglobales bacterium]|nr:hemerythrin domain-containing protein [Terriglobales bacterium]
MRHPSLIRLSHDHHHGLALALRCRKQSLGQIKPMGAEGLRERSAEVTQFFATDLVPHFRAEEEILFPLLRSAVPQSVPVIEQLLGEHEQISAMVENLNRGQGLSQILFDLGDLLERHIRLEERELFPLYEENVAADEAERTGEKIRRLLGG